MNLVERRLRVDHMDYDAIKMYSGDKFEALMPTVKTKMINHSLEMNPVIGSFHEASGYISKNLLWEVIYG